MSKIDAVAAREKLRQGYLLWFDEKGKTFRVGPSAVHANFARSLINRRLVEDDGTGRMRLIAEDSRSCPRKEGKD